MTTRVTLTAVAVALVLTLGACGEFGDADQPLDRLNLPDTLKA